MQIYIVVGYYDFEGSENIAVFTDIERAKAWVFESGRVYDSTRVYGPSVRVYDSVSIEVWENSTERVGSWKMEGEGAVFTYVRY
jgi:hypothetical protein